jgi:hypothetical protein
VNESPTPSIASLFRDGPKVVNLGIREFAESLAMQNGTVVHVDWHPPAPLESDLAALLEELE